MALRKPLVLVNGRMAQLPAGDTLDAAASEVDVVLLANGGGVSGTIGTPVYISAANTFQLARANALGTTEVFGLIRDSAIAAAATGTIQTDGLLTATTAEWDVITGQTGGLTPGAIYFLSGATAGKLTTTATTASGQFLIRVGQALSTLALEISRYQPIEL